MGLILFIAKFFTKKDIIQKTEIKKIIFDISIEVKFPNADNYSFLTLIECKSYSDTVPVGKIEEFYGKVNQVADLNGKGIFVTDNSISDGGYNFAKSKGITVIEFKNNECNFVLHRTNIYKNKERAGDYLSNKIAKIITKLYKKPKIKGLLKLSRRQIEFKTEDLLNQIDTNILSKSQPTPIERIERFIEIQKEIKIITNTEIISKERKILGCYNAKDKQIIIDKSIIQNKNYPFVIAHEIGHLFLHNNLMVCNNSYELFEDPEFNFKLNRYELTEDQHWIEWQANQFAASLLMPEETIRNVLYIFQKNNGIRNKGIVFYDNQVDNQRLFVATIRTIAKYLKIANINVEYRLSNLGIIKYGDNMSKHWTNFL